MYLRADKGLEGFFPSIFPPSGVVRNWLEFSTTSVQVANGNLHSSLETRADLSVRTLFSNPPGLLLLASTPVQFSSWVSSTCSRLLELVLQFQFVNYSNYYIFASEPYGLGGVFVRLIPEFPVKFGVERETTSYLLSRGTRAFTSVHRNITSVYSSAYELHHLTSIRHPYTTPYYPSCLPPFGCQDVAAATLQGLTDGR